MDFFDIDLEIADKLLQNSGGSVKTAIVMHKLGVSKQDAEQRLRDAGGFVKKILHE